MCLTRWRLEDDNLEVQSERLTLLDLPDIDSYMSMKFSEISDDEASKCTEK